MKTFFRGAAQHSGSVRASGATDPAAPGLNPGVPKKFSEEKLSMLLRLIDSAAAQSSVQQRLDNVNQTHLVQASGKLVLQKREWTKKETGQRKKKENETWLF